MRVVTGGDWSIGLGAEDNLNSALLNARLGEGLREIYAGLVDQPRPAGFSQLLSRLDTETQDREGVEAKSPP